MSNRNPAGKNASRPPWQPVVSAAFILLAPTWARAQDSNVVVVAPSQIVRKAVAHSPLLRQTHETRLAASAQRRQAEATGRPAVDARFQALHVYGLENEPLGPGVALPVIEDQYSASVGITQPLFTGGRVSSRKAATRLTEAAAGEATAATQADVILQALMAYWQWSKSQHLAASLQTAVGRARAHLKDIGSFKQAGMATESDVLTSEVLLDQTVLRLDEARRQAEIALVRLSQLIGEDLPPASCPEDAPDAGVEPVISVADAQALARTNRAEIAAARLDAAALDIAVRGARADTRPQISLSARYEEGRPNLRDFPPIDEWKSDAYVGATLSWTLIDSGFTRARIAEAKARARQSEARLQQIDEQIVAQVKEARINLLNALSRCQTAARCEASAAKNLTVVTDLWKNGLKRHSELLDAETALTDAQYQRIASLADLAAARAVLDHAMGRLRQE
jgi:outer membrane protein TolC